MAVIKVSTSVFSTIKSIERAIEKANRGDEIQLASGKYKESLTFNKPLTIYGKEQSDVIIEGLLIIPKNVTATFHHLTLQPTVQIYVEGHAIFHNCTIDGQLTNVILSVNNGKVVLENCHVYNADDVGLALLNDSRAELRDCQFEHNGKAHVLLEHSEAVVINSSFQQAKHSFWVKNESHLKIENTKIRDHTGTQIIVQNHSHVTDIGSTIEHGTGNGIYATKNCHITLHGTTIRHHQLPQVWAQLSKLEASNCDIQHGNESGIMLREHAEAQLSNCLIAHHKIANVQATVESLLNMASCQIHSCEGVGVQIREKSIVNFIHTTFAANTLSQLFITENSICTLKECTIKEGKQVGVFVEKSSNCTLVTSKIEHNANTALTVIDAELTIIQCTIFNNKGNGILGVNDAHVIAELSNFYDNGMPHIAGKKNTTITINQCEFVRGKSIYVLDDSSIRICESKILDGEGVQIEIADRTKALIKKCNILNGTGNAIKALRDSTLHVYDSQIAKHQMPQVVINDSSLIFKNSELLDGARNGFIIENNSEALIEESFISKHEYPQLWIDQESTVELKAAQLTEGLESDIYVQNKSSVIAENCIIRNDKFKFNVQAVNHSNIDLIQTTVENSFGDKFYSENNSFITHTLDEVN